MGVRPLPADHGKVCVGIILRDSAVLLGNEYSVVAWLVLCAAIKYEFRVFFCSFFCFFTHYVQFPWSTNYKNTLLSYHNCFQRTQGYLECFSC